ncbi:MAG: ester cyclase [Porticoccaceae bacterium]
MIDVEKIADNWAAAWAGGDTERFLALFSEDVVYRDDQAGRVNRGHDELRAFHVHFAQALSNVSLTFTRVFASGDSGCFEWRFEGIHSGIYHGRPPTGAHFNSSGASVLTFAPDGRIRTCTDYYDSAHVARQLSGASS